MKISIIVEKEVSSTLVSHTHPNKSIVFKYQFEIYIYFLYMIPIKELNARYRDRAKRAEALAFRNKIIVQS